LQVDCIFARDYAAGIAPYTRISWRKWKARKGDAKEWAWGKGRTSSNSYTPLVYNSEEKQPLYGKPGGINQTSELILRTMLVVLLFEVF
jgi:hypothetical protein